MIKETILRRLADLLGCADELWEWLYQGAMPHLSESVSKSEAAGTSSERLKATQ